MFCGSKKSLASGIPMAKVLFASHAVGAIVLPLMLFHQMQLMVCAVLAQRYARAAGGRVTPMRSPERRAEAPPKTAGAHPSPGCDGPVAQDLFEIAEPRFAQPAGRQRAGRDPGSDRRSSRCAS